MHGSERDYVPAAGRHWRLPLYDLMAWALGADGARRLLVEQVAPRPGERVLEVGCGTGALLVALGRSEPAARLAGLDPDPRALDIARRRAARGGVEVTLDRGFADRMPYPDASFDAVASCFMFHHLPGEAKAASLREVLRVLRPGGRLSLADFDGPDPESEVGAGVLGGRLHRRGLMRGGTRQRILDQLQGAGFADARLLARRPGLIRTAYYQASAPR